MTNGEQSSIARALPSNVFPETVLTVPRAPPTMLTPVGQSSKVFDVISEAVAVVRWCS